MNNDLIQEEYTITWHIDDVLSIRPDLTKEQASDVLSHACGHKHDASVGVNWDVLDTIADWHYPKEDKTKSQTKFN
tara:strand:- start:452 stop:679 length:228 start_codon:yes stop_codon:yes gene_type:complete